MLIRWSRSKQNILKVSLLLVTLVTVFIYLRLLKLHKEQGHNGSFLFQYNEIPLSEEEEQWENKIREYEQRIIPNLGNYGEPSYLLGKEKEEGENALKKVALNTVLSDRMPLDRILKDPRNIK